MKKSKIILLYSILILSILFLIKLSKKPKSIYLISIKEISGTIVDCKVKDNKTNIILQAKEKILVTYSKNYNCSLGDEIKVDGLMEIPENNRAFNQFNYKKYLLSKNIKRIFKASKIMVIKKNKNILYNLKNKILNHVNKYKSKAYLYAFVLADTMQIEENIKESYRNNGISHLLALSGTQVTILTLIIKKILQRIIRNKSIINVITIFLLIIYISLISFSFSIIRATFFYIFLIIKKMFKIKINNEYILIIILLLFLNYNPYYIYDLGFKLSFVVSFYLVFLSDLLKKGNYIIKSFIISLFSFITSAPIIINSSFSLNFLVPFLSIYFIPLFTFIIYPLSLLTFFIKPLDILLYKFINLVQLVSLKLQNIDLSLSFAHISIVEIIIYYVLVTFVFYKLKKGKNEYIIIILLLFLIYYNINYFNSYSKITMIDVGQGDSILIKLKNNKGNILIDTGGTTNNYKIEKNILKPYLKSEGIKKINYMIISHGDFDHMGEAINLINDFKVEKVIFNCGPYNDLEKELIKVLDKKKIKYYSCIKEFNIDNNKFYFLLTKEYDNENDNSNVIYTELDGYKFMFMGDVSSTTENEIMKNYNLPDIDVLKVGHHGSRTSSSKKFVDEINPKYSIISVGKNNRYGHPNKEVLDKLSNSKIYRTDNNGSVMFQIINGKLKVRKCS